MSTKTGTSKITATSGSASGTATKTWECPAGLIDGFMAYNQAFSGGVFLAGGDLNGDGLDEVIVGPDQGGGLHVRAFSTTTVIAEFIAYHPSFNGGVRVAAADIDGDT